MTAKHTPGPWVLEIDTVFIGDRRKVQPIAYHMDSEGIANARLIAAAPDLLAALIEMERVESSPHSETVRVFAREQAREAIAKATGQ